MLYQATIDPAASQLRLEFLRIVCSHEHYVTLNLPFPTPLYPSPPPSPTNSVSSIGSAMSSYTVIIGNSMAELSTAFRQQHFLAGLILSELALALEGGWVILFHSIDLKFSLADTFWPGRAGHSLIEAIYICAAPKGRVFAPFWSESGYRLCPFGSEIGYGSGGNS